MSKDRELKPCPFCGSDLIDIQSSIQMEQTDIRCTDCDIRISFKCCEEDAVQDWNKRSYKPLGEEELEKIGRQAFFTYYDKTYSKPFCRGGFLITEEAEVVSIMIEIAQEIINARDKKGKN